MGAINRLRAGDGFVPVVDNYEVFGIVGSITVVEPTSVTVHEVHATTSNSFAPVDITIEQGDVIKFINDGGEHNINSVDNTLICSQGCVGDGTNSNSNPTGFPWEIYVKFNQTTEISYFCQTHEFTGGQGIIRVIDTVFLMDLNKVSNFATSFKAITKNKV